MFSPKKSNPSDQSSEVPHYHEPDRTYQMGLDARLPTEVFSQALDHLVITCVDLVFSHQQQVLLAKRRTYPQKSWWVIGGRMIAGESPLQSAQRKAREEAGLAIATGRFHFMGVYSTCFAHRQQSPQDRGLHSLNLTYVVTLTAPEKQQLCLDPHEYQKWQWYSNREATLQLNASQVMDQLLLSLLDRVNSMQNTSGKIN
ncbi:NUDIX hydrolase [Acaryochloris sp. 'Moss Beach']|uniref:NUDIX domain-containing protein n=1 Tax=Acaryochloris sp. 'Moss Beach' TaxID=2740837 RepID=UPI001F241753|nr:NUDIX hydrolase [Acaryochloris sp. 'Moss Beach']UJB70132.1 NUDIX hydrolase [Acaryochloris sp. 'Moss Beach']